MDTKPVKQKLKWTEKFVLKKLIKKLKNEIENVKDYKRTAEEEEKLRKGIANIIVESQEVINITNEDGEVMTEKDTRKMSLEELEELLLAIINETEKVV